jgi:hypothetical protein
MVELAYTGQEFYVTDSLNPRHLQIRGQTPLWHKENMINMGVEQLLPKGWKAMAWIDADIEFENVGWAMDTLKVLNGCRDVVQLFSHAVDMDKRMEAMSIFPSFSYQFAKGSRYGGTGINMWHPGYAWAMTRKAYEQIGGLYDKGILGSGDSIMSLSFINKSHGMTNNSYHKDYTNSILEYQNKLSTLRLGYVPGVIRHYYHGTKKNRQYTERWAILKKHNYSPLIHVTYDEKGIIIPTNLFTNQFKEDIMNYFRERKEDE